MIHTYNEYHLGDQLIHLQYLRRVCRENPHLEFTHHCNEMYHAQLTPLLEDMPIGLQGLSIPTTAVNSWIGYANFFYNHQKRRDWVAFHLDWFSYLSDRLEVNSPMQEADDFLFDYPQLHCVFADRFDYLLINSPPASGQLPDYTPEYWQNRARNLINDGYKVITTHPTGLCQSTLEANFDVTAIGSLSKYADHIEAVDTGPLWTTFNIHSKNKVLSRKIYGTTSDTIDLAPNTVCFQTL